MPPISACELDDGIPAHQVMAFHTMAPIRAPNTTASVTKFGSTSPLPTVLATLTPNRKNAAKLKTAAQITACCGFIARVETTVAIEFAAS